MAVQSEVFAYEDLSVTPEQVAAAGRMAERWCPGNTDVLSMLGLTTEPTEPRRVANGDKTLCIAGHEFTEENTYRNKGQRICRECRRVNQRAAYATKAGA